MARIFVGNLPTDIRESELDDLFYKYGRIRDIDVKNPSRPPAFAFISFSDYRDAEDAVRGRDGYNFDGYRLRVEMSKGSRGSERDSGRDRGRTQRRSDYGLIISGLPRGASWQDLKDHMRKYGDVIYTDVGRDGEGVVEFSNRDDMEQALRGSDNSEFRSNRADPATIRVKARNDSDNRGRSPSRSRDRDDRDRRSRSRDRHQDNRDKRSPSPSRSRSGSVDRNRGRRDDDR